MKLEEYTKEILINEDKNALIVYDKHTLDNPKDPSIQVSNFGTMRLSNLRRLLIQDTKKLSKWADKPSSLLSQMELVKSKALALQDIENEMSSSQYKRKTK